METTKAEFKSCAVTGIFGMLISFSIVAGAHYLSTEMKKEEKKENTSQKVLKQPVGLKKANYWIPKKDR